MEHFKIISNPSVKLVFEQYPGAVRKKLQNLRELIIESARELEEISYLEETLKWNEPSYLTKYGSTLRIDWKPKTPNQYGLYFQCTSKLVPTFRLLYNPTFNFEGSRAIIFLLEDKIPKEVLKNCIKAALKYHKVKHLPALGL